MNWIQFRADQVPVNLDHIVRFRKNCVENTFCIKFFPVSDRPFNWDYKNKSLRDNDYQILIGIIFTQRTTDV
jgi:hypothetical protein